MLFYLAVSKKSHHKGGWKPAALCQSFTSAVEGGKCIHIWTGQTGRRISTAASFTFLLLLSFLSSSAVHWANCGSQTRLVLRTVSGGAEKFKQRNMSDCLLIWSRDSEQILHKQDHVVKYTQWLGHRASWLYFWNICCYQLRSNLPHLVCVKTHLFCLILP